MPNAANQRACLTCGDPEIVQSGEIAAENEFSFTCMACGTAVVIGGDGFQVVVPRQAARRRGLRRPDRARAA